MSHIAIEKHVSMPKPPAKFAYPYDKLEVDDSFAVPYTEKAYQNVMNANCRAAKKLGIKLTARKMGDVIRVWRTA